MLSEYRINKVKWNSQIAISEQSLPPAESRLDKPAFGGGRLTSYLTRTGPSAETDKI